MTDETVSGVILRFQSGFYTVDTGQGIVTCHLRGRLKRGSVLGDIAALGDRVQISVQSDGIGSIEAVEPRTTALVRLAPTPRGDYQQVLLSNASQVALVFSCAQPDPHLRMLDRFLVICEKQGLRPLIVANKVDLIGEEAARAIFAFYAPIGYPVIYTSTVNRLGLDQLARELQGQITGLAGPSGVGKTSLLNAIQPHLGLDVRDVSDQTSKGRHTTVVRQMFPLDEGGYVADLPGLRTLALWDTEPEELDGYFPDIRPFVDQCQFNDCTHRREPGCAVRAAVETGFVNPERYDSYLRIRFADEMESFDSPNKNQ
jgi:ribosome biogenesis GTPase / thiamine phosphate phosphatase